MRQLRVHANRIDPRSSSIGSLTTSPLVTKRTPINRDDGQFSFSKMQAGPGEPHVLGSNPSLVDSYTLRAWESLCFAVAVAVADATQSLVERLFAEHRAALQAFFRRRIRSKVDAPDLAQEVYVRMLRMSDTDAIRNPVPYLYTVASNLVKEHAVWDRRQASGIDVDQASTQAQLQTLPAFDGELDAIKRIVRLRKVLRQLRPKCRAAVALRYTHGLSYLSLIHI